ncbi:MAG: hypothetical protein AB1393_06115 [Candidatus Edwardsbacteria bacterium]
MVGIIGIAAITMISSFADSLYKEGDYFRAITEYKRLLFCGLGDSEQIFQNISLCYAKSGKYDQALEYLSLAIQVAKEDTVPLDRREKIAWFLVKSGRPSEARLVLERVNTASARKIVAISYFIEGKYTTGSLYLDRKYKYYDEKKIGLISTLLPGSGQVITGHSREGVLSFLINGGLTYFSYKALCKRDYLNFVFLSSWLLRFYKGNISRAKELAKEENNKRWQQLGLEKDF